MRPPLTNYTLTNIHSRNRKIRCDGAKPVCHNCSRRTASNSAGECSYDANPKRRGPDKTPGARQRMARELRNDIDSDLPQHRRRRRRAVSSTPTRTDTWDVLPSPLSLVMNQTTAAVSSPVYLVSSSSSNPVEDYLLAPNPIDGECRSSSYPDELTGPLSQV
jgi:hypothetical protein